MNTLASALRPIAAELTPEPRVYVDANLPWGAVAFMRQALKWDVLFVLEDPALRRAPDREHFRRARECGRTFITLDHDFADARRFPPEESPGVIILTAPGEPGLTRLLAHADRTLLREPAGELPLRGRVIELVPEAPPHRRSRRRSRRS